MKEENYIEKINQKTIDNAINKKDVDLLINVINKLIDDFNYVKRENEGLLSEIKELQKKGETS